jgi:hypothetical protein
MLYRNTGAGGFIRMLEIAVKIIEHTFTISTRHIIILLDEPDEKERKTIRYTLRTGPHIPC